MENQLKTKSQAEKEPKTSFLDRKECRAAFWEMFKEIQSNKNKRVALSYYGLMGSGKTFLLKNFQAAYEVDKENYEIQKRIYGEDSSMVKAALYRRKIEKKKDALKDKQKKSYLSITINMTRERIAQLIRNLRLNYQITTLFSGAKYILSVGLTLKALYHCGKLRGCMLALSSAGE